jgi:nitrile hydratase accessory protein
VTEPLADVDGPAAPPRSNGELVFEAPWESRAFGVAVALSERKAFEWEQFRRRLIAEIGTWEREHGPYARWSYYERWLASLEQLLVDDRVLSEDEIRSRMELLEDQDDHEHDHEHGHHHDHG